MTEPTSDNHDHLNPHGLTESDCPAGSACKEPSCIVHGKGGVLDRARAATPPTTPNLTEPPPAPPSPATSPAPSVPQL